MQRDTDPRLTLGAHYRLRHALDYSGVSSMEMADYLEINRNTVSNWINGKNWPRDRDLKRFALKTGFPLEWLRSGEVSSGGDGGGSMAPRSFEPGQTLRKITFRLPATASNVRQLDRYPRRQERELEVA